MASNSEIAQAQLHNHYFVVRHCQGESNVRKIIVSNPAIGSESYGLTDFGKEQARQTGENLMTILSTEGSSDVIIVTSQFKRANQTGEIIRKVLECPQPLLIDGALNERGFGSYDLQDSKYIVETRINDVHDVAKNTQHGIEHVTVVLSRTSSLVNQLEQTYTNKTIILVSHGDPIRILLAGFANINPSQYASIRRLDNGEIRRLTDPVVLEN